MFFCLKNQKELLYSQSASDFDAWILHFDEVLRDKQPPRFLVFAVRRCESAERLFQKWCMMGRKPSRISSEMSGAKVTAEAEIKEFCFSYVARFP